ncbi:MAG: hypothetical protein ACR2MM_11505, partial [Flavobacteriaceae bacterium]
MKKFLLLILCFIGLISWGQQKTTYQIGILTDVDQPSMAPLLEELKSEVISVVGEDAIIQFSVEDILSSDLNIEKARTNYSQMLNSDVDIILAFGLVNNFVMIGQDSFPKPTILFGAVNNDFLNIDKDSQTSGIENFTYLITSRSYLNDLATFHELTSFKKLAIVIQKPFMEVYPYKDLFDEEFEKYDAEYKLISFETYEDIINNIQDVDAVYLAEGFYLTESEIGILAETCIELEIPSFTGTRVQDVRMGLFATNQAEENLSQFFRRIALTVEAYIQGDALSEQPVYISY